MTMPTVSIIIPTFNREDFIEETVVSLFQQTFKSWEAVIVDDYSTDRTTEIIKQFAAIDSRIKLHTKKVEKKGAPVSRNFGIHNSNGEYIVFLDSDDLLAKNCLEERVKRMTENPQLDVGIFNQLIFFNQPGDSLILVNVFSEENDLDRFLKITHETDVPWVNNSSIWRKKSILGHQIFWDERLSILQDIDYNLQIFWNNLKYRKFNDPPDCYWRQHDKKSIGKSTDNLVKINSFIYLFEKIYDNLRNKSLLTSERIAVIYKEYFFLCIESHIIRKEYIKSIKYFIINKFLSKNPKYSIQIFVVIVFNLIFSFSDRNRVKVNQILGRLMSKSLFFKNKGNFKKHPYSKLI